MDRIMFKGIMPALVTPVNEDGSLRKDAAVRLVKALADGGKYKYATVERAEKGMSDRFIRILSESVMSIESAGNLMVIKTISASASAASEAIDSMKWPEVLGTIAGDNTILVIARSEAVVESLRQRFDALIKK